MITLDGPRKGNPDVPVAFEAVPLVDVVARFAGRRDGGAGRQASRALERLPGKGRRG